MFTFCSINILPMFLSIFFFFFFFFTRIKRWWFFKNVTVYFAVRQMICSQQKCLMKYFRAFRGSWKLDL